MFSGPPDPTAVISRITPQTKEEKARIRANFNFAPGVFGHLLDHECPIIVCDCVAYLRNRGFYEVGVFRIPGNQDVVNNLKMQYNNRYTTPDLKLNSGYSVLNLQKPAPSVNDVASLLKAYFTDLSEPLMPAEVTKALVEINGMGLTPREESKCFSKVLKRMKSPNRECLSFLISFLRELCAFRKFNNMTADNLSTCFVLSIMGKGDANTQIMLVGSGTKVLSKLISTDVRVFMPSVANVKRNTRYKDKTIPQGPVPPQRARPPQNVPTQMLGPAHAGAQPLPTNPPGNMPGGGRPVRQPRADVYGQDAENLFGGLPPQTETSGPRRRMEPKQGIDF